MSQPSHADLVDALKRSADACNYKDVQTLLDIATGMRNGFISVSKRWPVVPVGTLFVKYRTS